MSARITCPVCWRAVYRTPAGNVVHHRDKAGKICLTSGKPFALAVVSPDPEAVADIESAAFDAVQAELDDVKADLFVSDDGEPRDILIGSPEWMALQQLEDVATQLQVARDLGETL